MKTWRPADVHKRAETLFLHKTLDENTGTAARPLQPTRAGEREREEGGRQTHGHGAFAQRDWPTRAKTTALDPKGTAPTRDALPALALPLALSQEKDSPHSGKERARGGKMLTSPSSVLKV